MRKAAVTCLALPCLQGPTVEGGGGGAGFPFFPGVRWVGAANLKPETSSSGTHFLQELLSPQAFLCPHLQMAPFYSKAPESPPLHNKLRNLQRLLDPRARGRKVVTWCPW